ncbi:hypothetical protein BDV32DRAFT_86637 [Aspergillus pseudonomiae]|uniref:Uncharacterized protein n=1 Tax=Aspergillus pseudonomiae TaxID=1506151 RepID=A0A5N7D5C4_9EURO|nr:uncharacterized protein BDV37DRAFT_183605 [Aspergillus pseudonomiae]KAB8257200.1 hypothetical protein BDV32DRAFT_86637 [Aspergillus pseudonomiae]KAE8401347.1 hypothetical protein BDV37DRAFT_183605 [Aspergillus pseudonomiae]
MASPIEFEISPNPRTREENQERAFIAASRRKDRSLDARLESANRASQLHKQRTGKALLITREIVEKEAMYEEVDDRYKEKLQRMLEAQNLQINTQFQQNLLATLAMRPGLQHRRASMMAQRGPMDGVRKMSLDLSSIRSSFSEGMRGSPITSPMAMSAHPSYAMSPSYDGNSHSPSSFHHPNVVPASSGPMPSYIAQSTPTWPAHIGPQHVRTPWAGFNPGDMNMPVRQFRDRLGSAPVIPVHAIPSSAAYRPTPTAQHSRNRSEPGQTPAQRMPSHTPSVENTPRVEPRMDGLPTETLPTTLPTPDLCPTPSTPHSPTSTAKHSDVAFDTLDPKESDCVSFSQPFLDQDFVDFQGLSFSLGSNPTIPSFDNTLHHPETEWKPDEVVQMDDWLVGA